MGLKMFHQEIGCRHSKEHYQRVRTPVLGKTNMIGHEGQKQCTQSGDSWRELFRKEIDHWDGKGSENQRNDAKISLRFWKGLKEMGKHKE